MWKNKYFRVREISGAKKMRAKINETKVNWQCKMILLMELMELRYY